MVKLDRIVTGTGTGDDGRTSLGDGAVAHKAEPRAQAIGDIDEANACLGLTRLDAPRNADLPPLDSFVLPGGDPLSARLHLARMVTRRAERSLSALAFGTPVNPTALR